MLNDCFFKENLIFQKITIFLSLCLFSGTSVFAEEKAYFKFLNGNEVVYITEDFVSFDVQFNEVHTGGYTDASDASDSKRIHFDRSSLSESADLDAHTQNRVSNIIGISIALTEIGHLTSSSSSWSQIKQSVDFQDTVTYFSDKDYTTLLFQDGYSYRIKGSFAKLRARKLNILGKLYLLLSFELKNSITGTSIEDLETKKNYVLDRRFRPDLESIPYEIIKDNLFKLSDCPTLVDLSEFFPKENWGKFQFSNGNEIIYSTVDTVNYSVTFKEAGTEETDTFLENVQLKRIEKLSSFSSDDWCEDHVQYDISENNQGDVTVFSSGNKTWVILEDGRNFSFPIDFENLKFRKFLIENNPYFLIKTINPVQPNSINLSNRVYLSSIFLYNLKTRTKIRSDTRTYSDSINYTYNNNLLKIEDVPLLYDLKANSFTNAFTHSNTFYQFICESEGTFLVRLSDSSRIFITKEFSEALCKTPASIKDQEKLFTIDDVILSFKEKSIRRIDLNEFEAEMRISNKNLSSIDFDPDSDYLKNYPDLVEESITLSDEFTETMIPKIEKELRRAVLEKQSMVLLGKSGTGKTSSVRAFARKIRQGIKGIPRTLRILEINPSNLENNLIANVIRYKLQFLLEVCRKTGWILFIDRIHLLKSQGFDEHRETDPRQILKTLLSLNKIMVIGTDTPEEYHQAYMNDFQFDDKFEKLAVNSQERADLIEIGSDYLRKNAISYSSDAALNEAISLSESYDGASAQPLSLMKLLKTANSVLSDSEEKLLTTDILKQACLKLYKLNQYHLDLQLTQKKIGELRDKLDSEFVGQTKAKKELVSHWRIFLSGLLENSPAKSILLTGPAGVGKTQLVIASADLMEYKKTKIEMNSFGPSDLSQFKEQIAAALLLDPFQVIILDDFDKAPVQVQDAALNIINSGFLNIYGDKIKISRTLNTKNALFFLTATAGVPFIEQNAHHLDRISPPELRKNITEISDSILSRISVIVPMNRPTKAEFAVSMERMIDRTLQNYGNRFNVQFNLKNKGRVLSAFTSSYYEHSTNFHDLHHFQRKLDDMIADIILSSDKISANQGGVVEVDFPLETYLTSE